MSEISISSDNETRLQQIAESLQKPVSETLAFLIETFPLASDPAVVFSYTVLEAQVQRLWEHSENAGATAADVEEILFPLRKACQVVKNAMSNQPLGQSSQLLRELYTRAVDRLRVVEHELDLRMHFFDPAYWPKIDPFLESQRDQLVAVYRENGDFDRYYRHYELRQQIEMLAENMLSTALREAETYLRNGRPRDAIKTLLPVESATIWTLDQRFDDLWEEARNNYDAFVESERRVQFVIKVLEMSDIFTAWRHYISIDSGRIEPRIYKEITQTITDFTSLQLETTLRDAADALKRNFPEVATAILDDVFAHLPEGVLNRREFTEIRVRINRLRQEIDAALVGQGAEAVQVIAGRPNLEDLNIFISYSSKDRPNVEAFANDLKLLGCHVWFDDELKARGGSKWWPVILENIRQCDLFIFGLTPSALRSKPCSLEYQYAAALNKTILPVMLDKVELRRLPLELQAMQVVDYRQQSKIEFVNLLATLHHLPPVNSLPTTLPTEPDTPFDPVTLIMDRINQPHLHPDEQRTVIAQIEDLLGDEDYEHQAPTLLDMLVSTDYLTVPMLRKIEKIQAGLGKSG